jgi:hypothetical protein
VAVGIALAVVLLWGSVSSAYARPPAGKASAQQARRPVIVNTLPHVKLATVAHAAGHKIA